MCGGLEESVQDFGNAKPTYEQDDFQISPKPEMLTSLSNAERKHFRLWWNYENHRADVPQAFPKS